ncbi:Phage Mu protein F like protein [Levilactobacillus zymae DSM 19395]|nr:Phage Mu protein F like protein [Levilactobacillus zymae DSM 19395]
MSRWDRQEFRRAIVELDIRNWPDEATDRLDFYSGSYKDIDKRHMLIAIIALGLLQLTSRNQRAIAKRVGDDIKRQYSYLKKGYSLTPKQVGVAKHEVSVITDPRNVAQWSDRLWEHNDELAGDVERLINRHIRHGMDLKDLGKLLESHMNPKQFKPTQSVADRVKQMDYISQRLVRSESARLIDEANMTTYRILKVTKVDWVTEPGACTKCLGLANEGPYLIDEAPSIPGSSHPNCRCSKIPHIDTPLVKAVKGAVVARAIESTVSNQEDGSKTNTHGSGTRDAPQTVPLPDAKNVIIPDAKFDHYALDFTSPKGKDKARVFKSALGYTKENYKKYGLVDQIREGVVKIPAIPKKDVGHGPRYEVDIPVTGPNGQTHTVLTAWIVDEKGTRLTSPYIKDKKR